MRYSVILTCALAVFTTAHASAETTNVAKATPQPASVRAPGTPHRLNTQATIRSYYFTRTNASSYGLPQDTNVTNQATFNTALMIHGSYELSDRWSIAGTYAYANPLNNCTAAANQLQTGGPCSGKTATTGSGSNRVLYSPVPTNPDNTLPAFGLSTLYEAYVQYNSPRAFARVGNQLLTTPWANGSDTRLKPAAYQGAFAGYTLSPFVKLEIAYILRYESRVQSAFLNSTLLTATNQADAPGPGANLLIPKYTIVPTGGFTYGHLGYARDRFAANAYYYGFLNIAAAQWLDAKWNLASSKLQPYVAFQAGRERNAGGSVLGTIDSSVIGLQAGVTPFRNVTLTVGADFIPEKSQTLRLPAGVSCSSVPAQPPTSAPAGHQIVVTGKTPFMFFLPSGGTPNCAPAANGLTTVYYGGWASPYTDSYTSDPFFTTSMTGGMVERRSPGTSEKAALTWLGDAKRLRFIASYALYSYGNNATGVAPGRELDLDGQYYFKRIPVSGTYRGLSLRYRYGIRRLDNVQYYGGLPVFQYNRLQFQYDL